MGECKTSNQSYILDTAADNKKVSYLAAVVARETFEAAAVAFYSGVPWVIMKCGKFKP